MPRTTKAVTPVDNQGLTTEQRRLLAEIAAIGDWRIAAQNVGLSSRQVREQFKNQAFKDAYDNLFTSEELKVTQRELEMASSELGQLYQDAMQAEVQKTVNVVCPACKAKFNIFVTVMDWTAKLRAGETLLKLTRLMKDEKSIKMEGQVNVVHMELKDKLALWRVEMGLPVPPHVRDRLINLGLLDESKRSDTIEGEFKEVKE